MEYLLEKALVDVINQKRNKTLAPWIDKPIVKSEETDMAVFDIVDRKNSEQSIFVPYNTGTASYDNNSYCTPYTLRFVRYEDYMNQFDLYTKGIGRADFLVYEESGQKEYFIIHEISDGKINNKRSKARTQLFDTLNLLLGSKEIRNFIAGFKRKMCILTANMQEEESPLDMASGFNQIYNQVPESIPINAKQITNRGFEAIETRMVRLV